MNLAVPMQVNVHQAESQLSRLLELVDGGETVVIARHGKPVAELVPARQNAGFPFGIAREEPLVAAGDDCWQPMAMRTLRTGRPLSVVRSPLPRVKRKFPCLAMGQRTTDHGPRSGG